MTKSEMVLFLATYLIATSSLCRLGSRRQVTMHGGQGPLAFFA
jgi:hypothetical protein